MSLLDLTPSGIFETLTFDLPKHIDPLSRFINPAVECPCEAMVLSRACMESYPVPPLLVLFFATGGSAWTLSRELVGTAAGVDFVDALWKHLKENNKGNLCVRYLSVMMEVHGKPDVPVLMGCMHREGVRVATRLTPLGIDSGGGVHRAGDTTLLYCDPTNCLCESLCVQRIAPWALTGARTTSVDMD